jgi:hypothetical protein
MYLKAILKWSPFSEKENQRRFDFTHERVTYVFLGTMI